MRSDSYSSSVSCSLHWPLGSPPAAGAARRTHREPGRPPQAAAPARATLQIAAEAAALAYDNTSLEAAAGDVTIEFTNPSGLTHDVTLDGPGVERRAPT